MSYNYDLLKRQETDLTDKHYMWRIGNLIEEGKLPHWREISDEMNKQLGRDEEQYLGESAFRKPYQYCKGFERAGVFDSEKNSTDEIDEKIRELEQAKVKFRDQKNLWNSQNRSYARITDFLDGLKDELNKVGVKEYPQCNVSNKLVTDKSMIVCLSDLHVGQTFKSMFGEYNSDIAKHRLEKYLNKVVDVAKLHNVENIYIAGLGDQISNSIHKSLQVTNRENVIEQVKIASSLIADFCYRLTTEFNHVYYVGVDGNHTRLEKKEDAIHEERLDNLISWIIGEKLNHISNFTYLESCMIDGGIASINVCGKYYLMVHGDFDKVNESSVGKLCMLTGMFPTAILRGHFHTPSLNEINGVKVIQSGSLAGSGDSHTVELRLSSRPSQTILICDKNGIDCMYHVDLGD